MAERLGVPTATAPGLHEHERSGVPHLPGREFISLMELLFRRPGERVLGAESADEAAGRFERALEDVMASFGGEGRRLTKAVRAATGAAPSNLAVVSHGTVIALLLAPPRRRAGVPALAGDGVAVLRGGVGAGVRAGKDGRAGFDLNEWAKSPRGCGPG